MKTIVALILIAALPRVYAQDWVPLSSGTTVSLGDVAFVDALNGTVVGDEGTVLRTTDGGATWTDISPPGVTVALNAVYSFDSQTAVVAGANGIIRRTTDGGATWSSVASGVRDELLALSFAGDDGICGGRALDILSSGDAGASWSFVDGGYFCGANYAAFQLDSQSAYVAGDNCIFQPLVQWTNDGGTTWNFAVFYLNGNEGTLRDIYFHDESNGVAVSNSWSGEGGISVTADGGFNWTTTLYPDALDGVDFPTPDVGYAVGWNGSILRSDDGGATWTAEVSGTSAWLRGVDFADESTGYAVGESGTILKRGGGGGGIACEDIATFQAKCGRDRSVLFRVFLPSPDYAGEQVVFAVDGNEYPVTVESNGGRSRAAWRVPDQSPGPHTVSLIEPAGCFDPIIVQCDSTRPEMDEAAVMAWLTGEEQQTVQSSAAPAETELVGNFPNPFNPSTVVTYRISADGPVTLHVYNTLGQIVATLVDEYQTAGTRSVSWNGTTSSGHQAASGVYHYVLQSGKTVASGRMLLMK